MYKKHKWITKEVEKLMAEDAIQRFLDKIRKTEVIVMNKDKDWLNEQLAYYKDAVSKPAVNDFSRGLNGAYDTIQLLVDQLEEPMKIPELPKFVDEIIKDSSFIEISEIELVNKIKSTYSFLEWFGKKYPDASNREMERYLLVAVLFDYTVEKEPRYRVKLGKGYFGGFNELKVTLILNDQPGSMDHVIIYYDKKDALKIAEQIGGKVEDVTE